MTAVFADAARVVALREELERWRGTPFIGHTSIRGIGTDCIRFAASVLQSMGLIGAIEWPPYPLNGGGPELLGVLCGRIEQTGLVEVQDAPMPGDALVFSSERITHMGLVGEHGEFWHCLRGYGVAPNLLADSTFAKRLAKVYRLFEEEAP
jgi:hypothetical protein